MRGLKSTLLLLVVLIGLGAYLYFDSSAGDDTTPQDRVFASLETDDIQAITVKAAAGDTTSLKKEEAGWQIVAPIAAAASPSDVINMAAALSALTRGRVIDEAPASLAEYGLEPPRLSIEFSSTGDSPSGQLLIGEKTTTGANLYAKTADATRVFLIDAYQDTSFNRTTFDLREKTLLAFDRMQVNGVRVDLASQDLVFRKDGDAWRMVEPLNSRADVGLVEGLVGSVAGAQMQSVVTETPTPEQLRTFGLDRPAQSLVLTLGTDTATLLIGGPASDTAVYAKDADRPLVATIDRALTETIRKPAEDYRRRDVFDFRAFTATKAEFTRGGQTMTLERVPPAGDTAPATWRRVTPNPGDADRAQVESLLTGLADMRVTTFVPSTASTGLNAPVLTAVVTFEEGTKTETLRFGRSGANVYASRTDEVGALQIDATAFDEALKLLDGLAQPAAAAATPGA